MQLVYLSSPYSHEDDAVVAMRAMQAIETVALLNATGICVLCPNAHYHIVAAAAFQIKLPSTVQEPSRVEMKTKLIRACNEVWVLMLPGWRESHGVQEDIKLALSNGIPVYHLVPGETKPIKAQLNVNHTEKRPAEPFSTNRFA